MPRTMSSAALAKVESQFGTESIVIVEIQWVEGGTRTAYSDKTAAGLPGKILELSGLDDVVQVSGGSQSQQISVTLDDVDGSIKAIIDSHDVHKRSVWVYQWFEGLSLGDKFLIFQGQINTPIEWDEGGRSIRFDVISKIEDVEVGFSIEEGDFVNPPEELLGKAWPLCFGTVINVPALRATTSKRGTLATGTGIHDFTLERRIRLAENLICPSNFLGFRGTSNDWGIVGGVRVDPIYEEDQDCKHSKCEQLESLKLQLTEQLAHELSPVRVFGGNQFPQNKLITLNINGGKFTGRFSGEMFTITGRLHPENDGSNNLRKTTPQTVIQSACGTGAPPSGSQADLTAGSKYPDGYPGSTPTLNAAKSKASWDAFNAIPAANFFWANAGATVSLDSDESLVYIVNLLPSTILRVAAYREFNGGRQLLTVPSSYYTIRQTNYTGYTGVMEIVMTRPLSTRDQENGGGWSDDIYVTMTSTVGPNTIDIVEWFINTYTSYNVDATSFNSVRSLIDNFPMHFALLERKNLMTVLQEIAFQARCNLWLKENTFYIRYLAADPASDGSITEDHVMPNTLKVEHTPTEDLVTKYTAEWRENYAADKTNKVILRHNVKKYGTHEESYDFYCFTNLELVRKAATFWLIRKSNTWRRAKFQTTRAKLKLETFDTVTLTLPDVADGSIKGIIEKAFYNSDSDLIDFEVWTPCKSGTRVAYQFVWPADIDESLLFPTIEERNLGLAGGGTLPNFTVIAPSGHALSAYTGLGFFQSFALACNGGPVNDVASGECRADHGEKFPTDRGKTKPSPRAASDNTGSISGGTSPITTVRGGGGGGGVGNCCDELAAKVKQALAEAQNARSAASAAGKQSGLEDSETKPLKDAKKKVARKENKSACEAQAVIRYIKVTQVLKADGGLSSESGAAGRILNGDTPSKIETYTFNSAIAAKELRNNLVDSMETTSDSFGAIVGQEYPWITSQADPDLGVNSEGQACPEPDAEQRNLNGYNGPDVITNPFV